MATTREPRSTGPRPRQLAMLPPALEDAVIREEGKTAPVQPIETKSTERSISVIGEKQFKNPLLFPPPSTEGLDRPRKIRVGTGSDDSGADVEHSITVLGNNVTAGYSSDTLDVIAVINKIWRRQGCSPEGYVRSTYAEVVRMLGRGGFNEMRHRKHVARELERLRRCVLIFSQYHAAGDVKRNHEITYFAHYKYVESKRNPQENYFEAMLDPLVVANLMSGYIASLPLEALLALKTDHSKPVMLRVDSVLATHERCELASENILKLASLNPDSDWFSRQSVRKKTLANIQKDLDGKSLSSGYSLCVEMVRTADGKDWKLVFARGEKVEGADDYSIRPIVNKDSFLVQDLYNQIVQVAGSEDENRSLYMLYARSYPEELIYRACSQAKADRPKKVERPAAFFTSVLKRLAEEQGHSWIK